MVLHSTCYTYWVVGHIRIGICFQDQYVEEMIYSKNQEAVWKDVERLFGSLQSLFEILRCVNRRWDLNKTIRISNSCFILHNILLYMNQYMEKENSVVTGPVLKSTLKTEKENTFQSETKIITSNQRLRSVVI